MYLEHFGFNEAPFKITPHTEFFFSGASRGETLEALLYSITSGEGIVKVTGEVGAGKTMLCRVLMERLPETVETIYLAVPSLSRDEMLATIAGDLDIETQGISTTKLIRALQEKLIQVHAEGRQVVALIDEAHAMPLETLEEIRLLSNLETSHSKLMQIVLFGQPELDQHLALQNMRQLRERITHSFTLLPLPPRDIKDYVNFRLRAAGYKGPELFGSDALKLIAEASEGLTRRINIYCDKTLLAAFAAGTHTITPDLVRSAIADTQIVAIDQAKNNRTVWLASVATLIAGLAIGFLAGRFTAPVPLPVVSSATSAASSSTALNAAAKSTTTQSPSSAVAPESVAKPTDASTTGATSASTAVSLSTQATPTPANAQNPTPAGAAPSPTSASVSKSPAPEPAAAKPDVSGSPVSSSASTSSVSGGRDWLRTRAEADGARLKAIARERYSIQLMTADERERGAIEAYLRSVNRELNADRVMLYLSGTSENPKISVLYGNYNDRAEAAAELMGLPAKLTQFRPYARSFQAIRDDFRPAAAKSAP
jgi:MSHA biogenesis protein MshM